MQKCQNEEYLAVISGKNLIAAEQKINQLFVFKKTKMARDKPIFEKVGWVMLKDIPEYFTQCSMKFHFVNDLRTTERRELIFANIREIFKLNWETKKITKIYEIKT